MNPFDQFAGTLQAALPPQPPQQQQQQQQQYPSDNGSVAPTNGVAPHSQQPTQFSLMAHPTQEKKPVMNAMQAPPQQGGGMYGQQQVGQPGGMNNMYGAPPGPGQGMNNNMYGQQQPQPPPQQQMMMPSQSMTGGFGMGTSMNGGFGGPPPQNSMVPAPMPMGPPGGGSVAMANAGALVPSNTQSNPYALGPPAAAPAAAASNPFGAPAPPPSAGAANPFGAPVPVAPGGAMTLAPPQPLQQQQQQPPAPMMAMDPFGAPAPVPAQSQALAPTDPWGSSQPPPAAPASNALVPSAAPPGSDPWGVFGAGGPPPQQQAALPPSQPPQQQPVVPQQQQQQQQQYADPWGAPSGGASVAPSVAATSAMGAPPSVHPGMSVAPPQQYQQQQAPPSHQHHSQPPVVEPNDVDPWGDMFSNAPASVVAPAPDHPSGPVPGEDDDLFNTGLQPTREEDRARGAKKPPSEPKPDSSGKRKKGELPPGGEWYDAKIFTPTLGVMFFKPKELVDSLFLSTDKKLVESLDERPVVAFIVEGSSARSAGVELGHVLLKVNGIDVKNPKEASRLIKEGPRPLPLLFYVPETQVVVAEGEHMTKYNTKETGAPNSAKDWKPKYVVVGGIIAQPWMINMYRSKSEYDIAVIETQARRPVSVKVKQFSLQGARIQNDWQGPQMVKYKNKLHPWKYVVILPISRNPIKIASPNLSQLKPVHEGIRRVLQAQQRDRGGGGGHGQRGGGGGDQYGRGGGYDARGRDQGPPRNNGGQTSPNAYYGGRERKGF